MYVEHLIEEDRNEMVKIMSPLYSTYSAHDLMEPGLSYHFFFSS